MECTEILIGNYLELLKSSISMYLAGNNIAVTMSLSELIEAIEMILVALKTCA